MRGGETTPHLGPPAEELVKLAREELGEMSARRRVQGFLAVNARRSPGMRRSRLVLNFSVVLAAIALVLIGYRWVALREVDVLSYAVEGGRIEPTGALEAKGEAEP